MHMQVDTYVPGAGDLTLGSGVRGVAARFHGLVASAFRRTSALVAELADVNPKLQIPSSNVRQAPTPKPIPKPTPNRPCAMLSCVRIARGSRPRRWRRRGARCGTEGRGRRSGGGRCQRGGRRRRGRRGCTWPAFPSSRARPSLGGRCPPHDAHFDGFRAERFSAGFGFGFALAFEAGAFSFFADFFQSSSRNSTSPIAKSRYS